MPTSSPHLCNGCGQRVRGRCPTCSKPWTTSKHRGSTRASRKLRAQVLADQPICAWPGCSRLATEDDHVIPLHLRPDLDMDPGNHQGLCKAHHDEKTHAEALAARRRG